MHHTIRHVTVSVDTKWYRENRHISWIIFISWIIQLLNRWTEFRCLIDRHILWKLCYRPRRVTIYSLYTLYSLYNQLYTHGRNSRVPRSISIPAGNISLVTSEILLIHNWFVVLYQWKKNQQIQHLFCRQCVKSNLEYWTSDVHEWRFVYNFLSIEI